MLTLIQAEYPQSFSKLDDRQMQLKISLWEKEFALDDSNLVWAAVRTLLRSARQFAPSSGEIRAKMCELTAPKELNEQQAWSLVSKACTNGLYGYKAEFEKLPPEVQEAVGRPEQLKEWAAMEVDTVQSVVASNFMRTYRTGMARKKEMEKLPIEVREMLTGISMQMIGDGA